MTPTGYEIEMYRNLGRIAKALEKIATVLETHQFGISSEEMAAIRILMQEEMTKGRE